MNVASAPKKHVRFRLQVGTTQCFSILVEDTNAARTLSSRIEYVVFKRGAWSLNEIIALVLDKASPSTYRTGIAMMIQRN